MHLLTNPLIRSVQPEINIGKTTSHSLSLTEGQMIHGKIQQLFPGQLAEVQVGQHKFTATLEMPMRAGEAYYFQVASTDPEVQLKVVAGPIEHNAGKSAQIQQLLHALQLPNRPETSMILQQFMEQKIPIQREQIIQAVQLLQQVSPKESALALQAIQRLMDASLPLTNTLFQAVIFGESKEGLHAQIAQLRQLLSIDTTVIPQIKQSIMQTLHRLQQPLMNATNTALMSQSFMTLLSEDASGEMKFTALQLLKEGQLLPQQASLHNVEEQLTALVTRSIGNGEQSQQAFSMAQTQQIVAKLPFLTMSDREQMMQAAHTLPREALAKQLLSIVMERIGTNPTQMAQHMERLYDMLFAGKQLHTSNSAFANTSNGQSTTSPFPFSLVQIAEGHTNPFMETMIQRAETAVVSSIDGAAMKDMLQTVMRSLGVQYEKSLLEQDIQLQRLNESLKPQLLQISQQPHASATIREAAEQLLIRMNGAPLTSTDQGVQQQLSMHVPLEIFGKKIDATLEWNGRKKEDGKIDANHARILFYLDLHTLKETVIDMQVQNRVVTVTVFNDSPILSQIGKELIPPLKEKLGAIDYRLSGVLFKQFEREHTVEPSSPINRGKNKQDGKGVDVRV